MPHYGFKLRQSTLMTNNIQAGSLGNALSKLQFGKSTIYSPSFAATAGASAATGTFTISNAALGDMLFVTAGSVPVGLNITSACVTAASVASLYFNTSGCTGVASCQLTIQYLLLSGS